MPKERIIVFNGPPGSGKDLAARTAGARLYLNGVHCTHFKMSQPVKEAVHKLHGLFYDPKYYDDDRALKEQEHPLLFGMSPREAYIDFTKMIQSWYGPARIGAICANKLHNDKNEAAAFSDGGIIEEWPPVIDYIGAKNVLWVEINATRDGVALNFDNDSRAYIGDALKQQYPDLTVKRISNTISKDHFDKELFCEMVNGLTDNFCRDIYRVRS